MAPTHSPAPAGPWHQPPSPSPRQNPPVSNIGMILPSGMVLLHSPVHAPGDTGGVGGHSAVRAQVISYVHTQIPRLPLRRETPGTQIGLPRIRIVFGLTWLLALPILDHRVWDDVSFLRLKLLRCISRQRTALAIFQPNLIMNLKSSIYLMISESQYSFLTCLVKIARFKRQ